MITITVAQDGRVTRIGYMDETLPKGAIAVDAIPAEPETDETQMTVLYYTNGALEWRIEAAPPMPEPEPTPEPEPEPIPASEQRRMAYVAECDPYSMAYVGYMLEGNESAAAGCKAAYLQKKAEIRERIPDEEEP